MDSPRDWIKLKIDKRDPLIQAILRLDIYLQRQIYAQWPAYWAEMKWPIGSIRALLLIESGHVRTPKDVAEVLKVGKTTVTGMLDRLETDHLITRAIDPDDRRSFVLELTEDGRDLASQIDSLRHESLARALAAMQDTDLNALYQGLQALTQAMELDRNTISTEIEEDSIQL